MWDNFGGKKINLQRDVVKIEYQFMGLRLNNSKMWKKCLNSKNSKF